MLRLRLNMGVASLEEVELWADAWLMAVDTPPHALVDLAMARRAGVHDSVMALEAIGGGDKDVNPDDVVRALASADVSGWPYRRLENLIDLLDRWSSEFIFQGKEGMSAWLVFDMGRAYSGPPVVDPSWAAEESLRGGMLGIFTAARKFVADADARAGLKA